MPRAFTIRLTNWKQVITAVVLLITGVVGYSVVLQRSLSPRLSPLIEQRLKIDLRRDAVEQALPANRNSRVSRQAGEKFFEQHQNIENVKVQSIETRGWGSRIVAKVTFTLPDNTSAKDVRYYRLRHGWLTGWYIHSATTAFAYDTAWL